MRRFRTLAKVCLMTGCLLFLSGCHGSRQNESFTVPSEFDMTRNYEITFWAKNDTNKAQARIYQSAIDNFQKIYPNITVNLRLYTDYVKLYNDVITNISTGTTPNVCVTYPDHIATYLTGDNVVVPLDQLFSDPVYGMGGSGCAFDTVSRDEMIDKFLEEGHFNDHYYAVPFMRSTEVCYMNKTMIESLGYEIPDILTWDFVWEVSDAAAKKGDDGIFAVNGQKVMIPFIYKSTDNMMIQYLNQAKLPYSSAAGDVLIFHDDTRAFLYQISDHVKKGAFSTFKISSYPANFLNAGQCIFAIDSTAGSTWMGSQAPLCDISEDSIVDFETEVRLIPQLDPKNPSMISQGPSLCLFNKSDSQEVLASWLFTQYLLTNDVQIPYSETEGYIPVTKRAQTSPEYIEYLAAAGTDNTTHYDVKLKAVKLLLDNTENTFTTPVFNGSASLREAAGQLIEETVKGTRRKKTIDDAFMDTLYSDITSLYRLDQINRQTGKQNLGSLPSTAKWLLGGLIIVWIGIGIYVLKDKLNNKPKV